MAPILSLVHGVYHVLKKKRTTNRFQSPLAQRLRDDLILDGKRPRSIEAYLAAVGHLAAHFGLSPDKLSEEQIRQYLLLRSESLKKNSLRPVLAGIKFFYRVTVPREWIALQAMRIPRPARSAPSSFLKPSGS